MAKGKLQNDKQYNGQRKTTEGQTISIILFIVFSFFPLAIILFVLLSFSFYHYFVCSFAVFLWPLYCFSFCRFPLTIILKENEKQYNGQRKTTNGKTI
jgi:fatty acid desaturase